MGLQNRLSVATKRQKLREVLAETLEVDDVENVVAAIDAYVKAVVKSAVAVEIRKLAE